MLFLHPHVDPVVQSVLDDPGLLDDLVEGLGSPLNVLLPQRLAANVDAFRAVYRRHRLTGRISFAHKANRSAALLRELVTTEAGVDVASAGELQHALAAGFAPGRVVATGPKNGDFLRLAAQTGVLISADSLDELEELAALNHVRPGSGDFSAPPRRPGFSSPPNDAGGTGRNRDPYGHNEHGEPGPRIRVTARLSGFEPTTGVHVMSRRSRFGIPASRLSDLLDLIEKYADRLDLTGVAYHLDTIGLPEKAVALEGCLDVLDRCRARGLRPWSVGIGGGFGVNYLADGAQWESWTSELTNAVLGHRPPITWNNHGYGLRADGGTLRGSFGAYPAYRPLSGPAYLESLLETQAPGRRRPLGKLLLDDMDDLDIEPGRALLDQCGLVLARVLRVDGETVRLDLNARDVSLEEHGVLMDPIVIPRVPGNGDPGAFYLLGNLCLESDLITRRKVFLPTIPRPGDLFAFVNTAGYFMDFSATGALRQPVARKVALHRSGERWRWCLDEQYWPRRTAEERRTAGERRAAEERRTSEEE